MELRIIDGQKFIARRDGKREVIETLAEAALHFRAAADATEHEIDRLRNEAAAVHARIEAALLTGEPTRISRDELAELNDRIDTATTRHGESLDATRQIWLKADSHDAALIESADRQRITELTSPFDELLKAYQ